MGHVSRAAEADVLGLDASHWKPAQGRLPRQLLWSYVQGTSDLPFHELSWLLPGWHLSWGVSAVTGFPSPEQRTGRTEGW